MRYFLVIFSCLIGLAAVAQPGSSGFDGEIFGSIKDKESGQNLEYVLVKALNSKDSSMAAGVVSDDKGGYSLKIDQPGTYIVKFQVVGYQALFKGPFEINQANNVANVDVSLSSNDVLDGDLVIKGDKPLVTYELDKKIVNVEDQQTNAGQTAVEILANVPSISVDNEGNVMLRGSGSYTLLINGVPTTMDASNALASIPASSIENIEIITNPSAKYDAEGAAGIINIILKKKKLDGVSMLLNANVGNFENYGGDFALSIGKKKFTFNISAKYNNRNNPRDIDKNRTMYLTSGTTRIKSDGEGAWKRSNYGVNAEIQYEPNSGHQFILSSNVDRMNMVPFFYLTFKEYDNEVLQSTYENRQNNIIDMNSMTTSLFYQLRIKRDRNHTLTLKAINSLKQVDQLDSAMFYDLNGNLTGGTKYTEVGPANFNRFNIDYARQMKKISIETGAQVQLGYSADDGKNYYLDSATQDFILNPALTSNVDYTRDVYAGYGIVKGGSDKMTYQLGLRSEYTYRTVEAENFSDFATIKRLDWFPSAHFSFNLSKNNQILTSYSRRIQRPRSWYFEPFITWETAFNVRSGNPDLQPEYINSLEFNYIRQFEKDGFYSIETYYKYTQGVIQRVSTTYQEDVIITRPYNIGNTSAIGVEQSLHLKPKKWWEVNTGLNLFYFALNGDVEDIPFSNNSFNAKIRLTNTFKFGKGWQTQLVATYDSPTATAQGDRKGFYQADLSLRKAFSEGKYALNFQATNFLFSQVDHVTIITEDLNLIRINKNKAPRLTLTFTMKLNNYQKVLSKHDATDDF